MTRSKGPLDNANDRNAYYNKAVKSEKFQKIVFELTRMLEESKK
jgi:hypothetical protein